MDHRTWRSHERSAEIRTRMTPDEKAEIEASARAAGVTVQDYVWAKALGRPYPPRRRAGTTRQAQELPLTGS
ncbi:plasmid mobilization protein [Allobranchiibius huperziae]|uniref:plasmid mobilization protein n=1 Tax=Allobranchiibius huperziae TaxID=1874116 RepID=UPI003CCDA8A1